MSIKTSVLEDLGFRVIQNWLSNKCESIGGQQHALEFQSNLSLKETTQRLNFTEELLEAVIKNNVLPNLNIPEIKNWIESLKIQNSLLTANQFEELSKLLDISENVKSFCNAKDFPYWLNITDTLFVWKKGQIEIRKLFNNEFQIRSSASNKLNQIRKNINALQTEIQTRTNRIFNLAQSNNWVQEDQLVWKDERLMIPLQSTHKRKINGVVHSYSSTGQTAFVEPLEIIEKNNELSNLYYEENNEIQTLLKQLTKLFRPHALKLEKNYKILLRFDYHVACAKFANQFDCIRPEFSNSSLIIKEGKNPQLLISHSKTMPLNCSMEKNKILLISGPNAGGKTVAIKTVGMFSIMAQQGFFIPAIKAIFPYFNNILTDIGDYQSIENNLSTFSAHIENLKEIIKIADSKTLVLLDELGTATDPEAGSALARSTLEYFVSIKCFVLATTHLGKLKVWAQEKDGITNAGMIFDSEQLKPTFELQEGIPGSSYALEISNRLGLDKKIIDRAKTLIDMNIVKSEKLIEKLHRKSQEAKKLEKKHKSIDSFLLKREENILKKEKKLETLLKNAKFETANKTNELLKSYRQKIECLVAEIREKNADKKSIKTAKTYISSELNNITENLSKLSNESNLKHYILDEIKKGMEVSIPHLGLTGNVKYKDNKTKEVTLDINGKRIKLHIEKIFPLNKSQKTEVKSNISFHKVSKPDSYQLDLRGNTVDEAINRVNIFLDQSILSGLSIVHLIHGKGTGILQEAIQKELENVPFIQSYLCRSDCP